MADDEAIKPPPAPKLFKIFCSPVNSKAGRCIVESLYAPYFQNEEDKNMIIGKRL